MARNVPLSWVLNRLKAKLAASQVQGVSSADDTRYCTLIDTKQQWLSNKFDWPFLEDRWNTTLPPATRYLSFPMVTIDGSNATINFERPVKVEDWWSGQWTEVDYGIGSEEYNYINSDGASGPFGGAIQTLDPVQRWRFDSDTTFEVWPVPTSAQVIRFTGSREPTPLLGGDGNPNMSATLDLDDEMVWLYVAADILLEKGRANAQLVKGEADAHFAFVRQCAQRRTECCAFQGAKQKQYNKVNGIKQILVAGNLTPN